MGIRTNVLIVDDHPFIIKGYKNGLDGYNTKNCRSKYDFIITEAIDCRSGYDAIMAKGIEPFDIAFFDLSMPIYEKMSIFSGEDLALLMRKQMPDCKIIILTMFAELFKLNTIIKNINPHGLIIKIDLDFKELLVGFDKIFNDERYYSKSVVESISQSEDDPFEIDKLDKLILVHLLKETKMKDIPQHTSLSLIEIDKRKSIMKENLGIPEASDLDLVLEAQKRGVIIE